MKRFGNIFAYTEEGKTWPQVLAILIGSLSSFLSGMSFSWPSPFIPKIIEDHGVDEADATRITIISPIAMLLTCPFTSALNDKIGRKRSLGLATVLFLISWIIKAYARGIYVFYLARCFSGIAEGMIFSSLPMYIGEVASPEVRGSWGNMMTIAIFTGGATVNNLGIYSSQECTSYIAIAIVVLFGITLPLVPESPYYYLMRGRENDARASLKKLLHKINIEHEFGKLQSDIARQTSETGKWKELYALRSNRKALIGGIFLRVSQQCCGATSINVYTKYIFLKSGSSISPDTCTIIYTATYVMFVLAAAFNVDRFGRKKPFMYSLALCGINFGLLSAYFYTNEYIVDVDLTSWQWVPLAGMFGFIVFSSFGVAILPTLMLSELFSVSIKTKGLTMLMFVFAMCQFATNYVFYILNSSYGLFSPFLFFCISGIVSCWLCMKLVPETSGRSLEEIQQSLKGKLAGS